MAIMMLYTYLIYIYFLVYKYIVTSFLYDTYNRSESEQNSNPVFTDKEMGKWTNEWLPHIT